MASKDKQERMDQSTGASQVSGKMPARVSVNSGEPYMQPVQPRAESTKNDKPS